MENETLTGLTVVDSPLPYAVDGNYVNEEYLTEQIDSLWKNRQAYDSAIQAQRTEMLGFETTLREMLFTMKAVLSRPGRSGGWSSWLKARKMPRATADRMVLRYAATLPESESPHDSIQTETSDVQISRLFAALWPRIEKTLTTPKSRYDFIRCLVGRSALAWQWQEHCIVVCEPGYEPVKDSKQHDGDTTHGSTDDGDVL
jgi:hypothetical protein